MKHMLTGIEAHSLLSRHPYPIQRYPLNQRRGDISCYWSIVELLAIALQQAVRIAPVSQSESLNNLTQFTVDAEQQRNCIF